jgi:hypothetical protein
MMVEFEEAEKKVCKGEHVIAFGHSDVVEKRWSGVDGTKRNKNCAQ